MKVNMDISVGDSHIHFHGVRLFRRICDSVLLCMLYAHSQVDSVDAKEFSSQAVLSVRSSCMKVSIV